MDLSFTWFYIQYSCSGGSFLSTDQTHLRDPLFAPLAYSFTDTDYTLYSPVQSLLNLLQGWHHGDVWDGECHINSEDCLLTAAFATTG